MSEEIPSVRYSRQEKIVPQKLLEEQNIVIIGVGAVGREVARTLACNGAKKLTIYDFDIVEEHNCATQGYHDADINRPKVECTAEEVVRLNKHTSITAVSMREKLFNWFCESASFIGDSRIGGEQIRLLSATDDASRLHYPTTIGSDADAHADGCHIPMVKHSANIAASMLVQQYIQHLKGMPIYQERIFSLPVSELTVID